MANSPTVGVYIPGQYLNTSASASSTGATDPITGNNYPTGLNVGKVIEISDLMAASLTAPGTATSNQLFGGAYQWVQVDSAATAANVAPNLAAFIKWPTVATDAIVVTDEAHATAESLPAGVFIQTITPGQYGFIFVGAGKVNVAFKTPLTTAGAVGNTVNVGGGSGTFDSFSATAVNNQSLGIAVTAPAASTVSPIYIKDIIYRIPAV